MELLSDDNSSKLITKHLKEIDEQASDYNSKIFISAANNIVNKRKILRNAFLRTIIFAIICILTILLYFPFNILCILTVCIISITLDYYYNKYLNKNFEKIITLSADIDEKHHVLKLLNNQLHEQNKLLSDKVNVINQLEIIKEEKHRVQSNLANITSYNNHLTNIIRGVNHEVSPWLGSIGNIACIAKEEYTKHILDYNNLTESDVEIIKYLDEIRKASRQAADVLVLTSKNVKKLRTWSTTKSNLLDTIRSWGYIALMEQDIKGKLSNNNLIIDHATLDFDVLHSPMLISQIILNLVKNSIDHNEERYDDLSVKIYGDSTSTLFVEDNGKGISPETLSNIFKVGVSTKNDSHLPTGIGLANTVDYCMLMGAVISVESKVGKFTRFGITFKTTNTDTIKRNPLVDDYSGNRSAYYNIIINNEQSIDEHNINSVEHHSDQKTTSNISIKITPKIEYDTDFRLRMADIDETLKKLT